MRTEAEVQEFTASARTRYIFGCKTCSGFDENCECSERFNGAVAAYEACIPQDFWNVEHKDVTHNKDVFNKVVVKYTEQLNRALRRGYGLVFLGDNGVGKTMFTSFVLMEAIRKGRTAYYTTMPRLDYDVKRGWKDAKIETRLHYMLTSDFVAIDEMGKEKFKADPTSYMGVQIERILKSRFDDSMPVILASNMDYMAMTEAYGPTIGSILIGKYQPVAMGTGDFRRKIRKQMVEDMGYES